MDKAGKTLYRAWQDAADLDARSPYQRQLEQAEQSAYEAWAEYAHEHDLCLQCSQSSGRHSYCDDCRFF